MMRRSTAVLAVLVLVSAMATGAVRAEDEEAPRTDTNDAAAVMAAMAQFYTALNAVFAGDAAPMSQVWSQGENAMYMGPMGAVKFGWAEIAAHWKATAAKNLGGQMHSESEQAVLGGNLAVIYAREKGHHMTADGQREEISIRATSVFRKEDGQWKMIGHHTDPYSSQEE